MPSLGCYESSAQKVVKQRDIWADVEAGNEALRLLCKPWGKLRSYSPSLQLLRGNHENRIQRAIDDQPWLAGVFDAHQLESPGWQVHEFLKPVTIDSIKYAHYFCRSADGHVTQSRRGHPNARIMVQREGMSCTAGHKQGLDVHIQPRGHTIHRGIVAGSFYMHHESYLTPQGNQHWRGVLMKHEVYRGNYQLCEVSLDYLLREYL